MDIAANTGSVRVSGGGSALAGFLVSGFVLALIGAILPAWGYHRDPADFVGVGNFFLSLALGIAIAARVAHSIMVRRGVTFLLVAGCGLACLTLIYLAMVSPPLSNWWRAGGLLVLGFAAGLLNLGLFYAISHPYRQDPAGTISKGGILYGLGCLIATILVAGSFYAYTVPAILISMAFVPGVFGGYYARKAKLPPLQEAPTTIRQALQDFKSPGAILFALLIFFQFGNEWSIAGWLPIYLIRRVGLSPSNSLTVLAVFWLMLIAGRLGAIAILRRVRHGRLLSCSMMSAIFGCLMLASTDNWFGASVGACFVGAGFASIYPLVLEAIGRRFPYYHPGIFNSIFSLALLGGLLAPATLGYAASYWGVGVVIGIPLAGSFMVVILMVLIWLEAKVTGR
jgi:hypothetical protein